MATPAKEAALKMIQELPDSVTWDELAYKMEVRASIERGLADSKAGRVFTIEEIKREFNIK